MQHVWNTALTGPAEDARRLAANVRRLREAQALSLNGLSQVTGLSKANLSRIERGSANPSLETLWCLARALGVTIGELIEDAVEPEARVIRSDEGAIVESGFGMRGRLLHTGSGAHRTEVFELKLPPGSEFRGAAHIAGTRELVYCTVGTIITGLAATPFELKPGDAAYFSGSEPHIYRAGPEGGRALLVMSYPIAVTPA